MNTTYFSWNKISAFFDIIAIYLYFLTQSAVQKRIKKTLWRRALCEWNKIHPKWFFSFTLYIQLYNIQVTSIRSTFGDFIKYRRFPKFDFFFISCSLPMHCNIKYVAVFFCSIYIVGIRFAWCSSSRRITNYKELILNSGSLSFYCLTLTRNNVSKVNQKCFWFEYLVSLCVKKVISRRNFPKK